MSSVPNINTLGATKQPNIDKIKGPREGGGAILVNSLEIVFIHGFFASN